MLEALQSRRRRKLLVALAEETTRNGAERTTDLDTKRTEEEFLTRLRHVDLPKLEDMGFIEWDRGTGEIVEGPEFSEIQPLVELMIRHEDGLPNDWL